MRIHISGAEQLPYDFKAIKLPLVSYTLRKGFMKTADYGVCRPQQTNILGGDADMEWKEMVEKYAHACAVIERKTLSDFCGSVGKGRDNFDAEMRRMKEYGFAAVVIEADWSMIFNPNAHLAHPTKLKIKSAVASVIGWSQRYGIHFHAMANRAMSEQFTYRLLERWMRDGGPA